jgi:hypothetical protein
MEPASVNRTLEHDQLKLLYQSSVADLAYFKQQQWSLANYALLLFAGLVGAAKLLPVIRTSEPLAFGALVVLTAVACSVVLWKHEAAIEIRRARLAIVRNVFSEEFNRAWGVQGKRDEVVSVAWLLQFALVLGAVVSLWVLGRQ